jgi:thiamine biosynthesis lipoprotein
MLEHNYRFEAFGTEWVIETNDAVSLAVKKVIQDRIEAFDTTYSRFRDDSLVTEISHIAGEHVFPPDAKELFNFYKNLYGVTGGKVTPLIGDMISRAGYDAVYSLQAQPQMPALTWNEAMSWNGLALTTTQPVMLDVGAVGKGYAVDIVATILDEHFDEYVVDASGDMRHKGTRKNTVGLEHPLELGKVIGAVEVQNKSLCASATNRRSWGEGMHHIFDPDTMAPTKEIIATWVIANEAMVADGLATALFFVDANKLRKIYDFEYVRMHASGLVEYSPYFEGKLFLKET